MDVNVIENYIERIYGFAVRRTFSREEAEELSQEILFTAVSELSKLKDDDKFEPWLWGVANNIAKSFCRHRKKQREMYSYDVLNSFLYEEQYEDAEEEYGYIREKIAMLSAMYRDIIVFYYYDGLSVKQISEKLNIPEGTVTWRLSEARKKLKKEYTEMTETSLKPVKMRLDIYGNGNYNGVTIPFPTVYISDALSVNILYCCYEQAKSIEEISKICGVPAYYVEERIDNLLKREAVIETVKNKYQTDFVIFSDKYGAYCEENAEKSLKPVMDGLLTALNRIASAASEIDFYKAEKSESDLFYLYGAMAFAFASEHYCKLPYPPFGKKYDGNEWCYIGNMETGKYHRTAIGIQHSANLGSRGCFSHTVYNGIGGMAYRQMMYANYINVCEDIIHIGSTEDTESAANAIRDGYIIKRQNGSYFLTVPAFNEKQYGKFNEIADKYLAPIMPQYSEAVENFIRGYKKLFPRHLSDDADRLCHNIFMSLYAAIVDYWQKAGAIKMPTQNSFCDVMIQRGKIQKQ